MDAKSDPDNYREADETHGRKYNMGPKQTLQYGAKAEKIHAEAIIFRNS